MRHRLNLGGDRQADNALWRIATDRLRCDERTQAHAARRRAEHNNDREIIRCLKRHNPREAYRLLTDPPEVPDRETCADNEPNTDSPSTPQPAPSTHGPQTSQLSKEDSYTTVTSPNATNNTSPKPPLDKHRSIALEAPQTGRGSPGMNSLICGAVARAAR